DQSFRIVARLTLGGPRLRARLSNVYGSDPVTFTQVRVALRVSGPAVDPATDHQARFGGKPRVTVPAGREIVSDEVSFPTRPGTDVAVSFHVVDGVATRHPLACTTHYASPPGSGDATADIRGERFTAQ